MASINEWSVVTSIADSLVISELQRRELHRRLQEAVVRIDELTRAAEARTHYVDVEFLQAMEEIGEYGNAKHGADSMEARKRSGSATPRGELLRNRPEALAPHAAAHFVDYLRGVEHDHFHDGLHQLAAVAYNAMMEAVYVRMEASAAKEVKK